MLNSDGTSFDYVAQEVLQSPTLWANPISSAKAIIHPAIS